MFFFQTLSPLRSINSAEEEMKQKIALMNKVTFSTDDCLPKNSEVEKALQSKNNEIDHLRKALEEERKKTFVLKSTSNINAGIRSKSTPKGSNEIIVGKKYRCKPLLLYYKIN